MERLLNHFNNSFGKTNKWIYYSLLFKLAREQEGAVNLKEGY